MSFWKTVGAVVVGGVLTGVVMAAVTAGIGAVAVVARRPPA